VVVVASKGGADQHPAWYLNIKGSQEIAFQIATQAFRATWREPAGAERDKVWGIHGRVFPPYKSYQASNESPDPLVMLTARGAIAVFEGESLMSLDNGRYNGGRARRLAPGWTSKRLTQRAGFSALTAYALAPDGRIYVAQVSGSQISAIDVNTGAVEAIVPMGGSIVAPDDLVFDTEGNLYATEITEDGSASVHPMARHGWFMATFPSPIRSPFTRGS